MFDGLLEKLGGMTWAFAVAQVFFKVLWMFFSTSSSDWNLEGTSRHRA